MCKYLHSGKLSRLKNNENFLESILKNALNAINKDKI